MNRDRYESLQYDGRLFNEIRRIENEKRNLQKELQEKDKEIERLNNIIDKFEKYLINEIKRLESVEQTPAIVLITGKIHDIYDELQELKEGEK